MLAVTLKGVRGHLLRFVLTAASVMLGVAFVAGTFVLTDSLQATFDKIFNSAGIGTDVVVRAEKVNGSVADSGDLRTPLPMTLADRIAQVDGVRSAYPALQGSAVLVGRDGTAVRNGGAPTLGFDFRADDPALPLTSGRGPQTAGEVAVEDATLTKSGLHVGDRTRLVVAGNVAPVTIVGTVHFAGGDAGQTIVVLDKASAQRYFAADGTVQEITVQAENGLTEAQLRDRVQAALPQGVQAITGADYSAEQRTAFAKGLGFVSTFLLAFALVSLLVGTFIIFNTFSMLVAQRTRELALLRALGASRGQVIRVVLGEATVIGLAGGVLGLAAGAALASLVQWLLRFVGLKITGGLPVHASTVVAALGVGVAVTLLAAVLPALRAGRIAPVTAMRDDVALPERSLRLRGALGGVVLAIGAAVMVLAVVQLEGSRAAATVGAGTLLALLGVIMVAPLVSRPVIRVVGLPAVAATGTVGRLARDNTLRNPRRTSTTAVALVIGLLLVSGFGVVASSTKASVNALVDDQVRADYILTGGNAPFPSRISEQAAKLPGVAAVVDSGAVPVRIGADTTAAAAVSGRGLEQTVALDVTGGALSAIDDGKVGISTGFAKDHHLAVGAPLTANIGVLKARTLTVGVVYKDSQAIGVPVLLPRSVYAEAVPASLRNAYAAYVKTAPGADPAQVRRELTDLVKPFLVVSVQDREEFKAAQAGQINQLLAIIYGMLALALIIATLGIINTLALSVFERTREIGLLRAVGMSRRQLGSTITLESVQIALFGAVLGVALGLVAGVMLQRTLVEGGLTTLSVPWMTVVLTFVASGVVGALAALFPAWRATRLNVLRAVATE